MITDSYMYLIINLYWTDAETLKFIRWSKLTHLNFIIGYIYSTYIHTLHLRIRESNFNGTKNRSKRRLNRVPHPRSRLETVHEDFEGVEASLYLPIITPDSWPPKPPAELTTLHN